jgi:hypothetical protein
MYAGLGKRFQFNKERLALDMKLVFPARPVWRNIPRRRTAGSVGCTVILSNVGSCP